MMYINGQAVAPTNLVKEGHNYSTTEQVVGTYIDGKPVYEKTIIIDGSTHTFASGFNNVEYSSNYPVTNIDEIIGHNGSFRAIHKTDGFKLFSNIGSTGATSDQYMYLARVNVDNGNLTFIQFNIPSNMITYYQSHRVVITFRYTKTTD